MTIKLTSYINLKGNAKEALDFYQSIFGGVVEGDTFGEFNEASGGAMPVSEEDNDKIMHATLMSDHVELMMSDYPSTWTDTPEESNISLTLSGDDDVTLRRYWDGLAEDGVITQPLEAAPWGDVYGSLDDKFGVRWIVNISPAKDAE